MSLNYSVNAYFSIISLQTIEPGIRVLVDSGKVRWDLKARNGKTCRDIAMSPLIVNLMKEYASKQKKEL